MRSPSLAGRGHDDLLGLEALVALAGADQPDGDQGRGAGHRRQHRAVPPGREASEFRHSRKSVGSRPLALPSPVVPGSRWWRDDPAEGTEPDYRFTLANERTFLAWIRTALGLLAGGVAVRQLVEPFEITGAPHAAGPPGDRRQRRARRRRLPALGRRCSAPCGAGIRCRRPARAARRVGLGRHRRDGVRPGGPGVSERSERAPAGRVSASSPHGDVGLGAQPPGRHRMTTDVERDEGLANERTALAWWRTALAAVVAAGLIVRGAAGPVETVAMGCTAGAALAVLLTVALRRSRGAHGPAPRRSRGPDHGDRRRRPARAASTRRDPDRLTGAGRARLSATARPARRLGTTMPRARVHSNAERARRLLQLERLVEHEPHVREAVDHRARARSPRSGRRRRQREPLRLHPLDRCAGHGRRTRGGSPGGCPAARR